ncbi:MAG: hypothetical protein KIS96_01045 [Bauldia sp.]|nr:hypothetical protein [Bauldia sp.]
MIFSDIERNLMPWQLVGAWVVVIAAAAFMAFGTIPHIDDVTGGLQVLSLHWNGFDHDEVHALAEALGEEGLLYYAVNQVIAELVFAIAAFLALTITFLWVTRPGEKFALPLPEALRLAPLGTAVAALFCHVVTAFAQWGVLASEEPASGVVELASTTVAIMQIAYIATAAAVLITVVFAILRGLGSQPAHA